MQWVLQPLQLSIEPIRRRLMEMWGHGTEDSYAASYFNQTSSTSYRLLLDCRFNSSPSMQHPMNRLTLGPTPTLLVYTTRIIVLYRLLWDISLCLPSKRTVKRDMRIRIPPSIRPTLDSSRKVYR